MEMTEGVPTDLAALYQLLKAAATAKDMETLEAYYRENVGSPTDGGHRAALMSEQYALEEGEREKGDREQFEEYRLILGEDAPESFAKFLDLKYNHPEKWDAPGTMKQQTVFVNNAPCVTTPEKYTGYFLKMGAKHAVQFFNVGYTQDNPLQLRYDMARQFDMSKAVDIEILEDGAVKFNIYMELGVVEKRMFRTGWRIDKPGDKPRIIMGFRRLRDD